MRFWWLAALAASGCQRDPAATQCGMSSPCVDAPVQTVQVTVGGTVGGLTGQGLVLRDNDADDLAIAMSGAFTFAGPIVTGDPYLVTVAVQPSNPSQACAVANASGTAATTNITDVAVTCTTASYVLGGTVIGLTGSGLVLTDGAEDLPIATSGAFAFTLPVASGAMYAVSIRTQSANETCMVVGGTGTVGVGNVMTVVVNCSSSAFTISGTVSGLDGTVTIHDATAGTATLTANGSWALPMLAPASATYEVVATTQPAYPPREQTCVIANGSGTISGNVGDVAVTCTTNRYTVGGMVSGLAGTLVLQANGGDDKTITANGAFTFATPIASATPYEVSIKTQPPGQLCTLANSSGTVTTANIANVDVTCAASTDPGISCGATYCNPAAGEICCVSGGVGTCTTSCMGASHTPYKCDDAADCAAAGKPGQVCCGSLSGSTVTNISCAQATLCTSPKVIYCDPGAVNPCPNGGSCVAAAEPTGYYWCK